jgi:moderate conductance mechanosensitive channel
VPNLPVFTLNWAEVTALSAFKIIGIVLVTALIARGFNIVLKKSFGWIIDHVTPNGVSGDEALLEGKRLHTLLSIGRSSFNIVLWLFASLLILSEMGINIGPLLAGAGVLGVAVAFGAQSLVKDVFYGFFILAENQFSLGDVIQVDEHSGQVERMTFRTVTIRDLDGRAHIIPNGEINKVIVASKQWARANVDVLVPYDTDLDAVFAILKHEGQVLYQQWPTQLLEPPQVLGVESLESTGVKIKVLAKTKALAQWDVMRELRKRFKTALQQQQLGFVPVLHRVVTLQPHEVNLS